MKRHQLFVDLKINKKTGPFSDHLREMIQTLEEDGYIDVEVHQVVKVDKGEYLIIFYVSSEE
ncbi:hypothetical protein [Brevibacillus aydinogluensis]|jgi:hypothetical protein|uniref:Uncharacterized protein n=1 Tax=Brevibacillus aydinogluensis TaxID=927786 RepID=A0AA48M9Y5_9BACL|nr:hypothetical protein [Brevibacillus aydinogluensis]CAJ1002320.1 hypothetical protein BSPP4475_08335 [Brevibacillus aydinogluensis]